MPRVTAVLLLAVLLSLSSVFFAEGVIAPAASAFGVSTDLGLACADDDDDDDYGEDDEDRDDDGEDSDDDDD